MAVNVNQRISMNAVSVDTVLRGVSTCYFTPWAVLDTLRISF